MPVESLTWFECQSKDSIASHFVNRIHCLSTFWNFTIMASVATKHLAENKSYKIKYKALKELEKGTPHKDVASLFGAPKKSLSTWNKNIDKIFAKYNSDLISKRVKPEKYEEHSKTVHKWFFFYKVKMFQSVGQCSRKSSRILQRIEHWGISSFWGMARKIGNEVKSTFLYISKKILNFSA